MSSIRIISNMGRSHKRQGDIWAGNRTFGEYTGTFIFCLHLEIPVEMNGCVVPGTWSSLWFSQLRKVLIMGVTERLAWLTAGVEAMYGCWGCRERVKGWFDYTCAQLSSEASSWRTMGSYSLLFPPLCDKNLCVIFYFLFIYFLTCFFLLGVAQDKAPLPEEERILPNSKAAAIISKPVLITHKPSVFQPLLTPVHKTKQGRSCFRQEVRLEIWQGQGIGL